MASFSTSTTAKAALPASTAPLSAPNTPFTPEEIKYQLSHAYETKQPMIYAVLSVMIFIAIAATALRFYARRISMPKFWADDWLLLASLPFALVYDGLVLTLTVMGGGRHTLTVPNLSRIGLPSYVASLFNPVCIALVKLSIIILLMRIFPVASLHRFLIGVAFFVVTYNTAIVLTEVFACTPVSASYSFAPNAHCIDGKALTYVAGAFNAGTDVLLLVAPLPELLKLQVSWARRVQLLATFMVGGLVCIVSIIRIVLSSSFTLSDPLWLNVDPIIWASVECSIGILCACLPTYRPILNLIRHGTALKPGSRRYPASSDPYSRSGGVTPSAPSRNGKYKSTYVSTGLGESQFDDTRLSATHLDKAGTVDDDAEVAELESSSTAPSAPKPPTAAVAPIAEKGEAVTETVLVEDRTSEDTEQGEGKH